MAKIHISGKIDPRLKDDIEVISKDTGVTVSSLLETACRMLLDANPVDDLMRRRVEKAEMAKAKRMEKMGLEPTTSALRTQRSPS